MDTLHTVLRNIRGETKSRRDHLSVFREFLGHLDRIGPRSPLRRLRAGAGALQRDVRGTSWRQVDGYLAYRASKYSRRDQVAARSSVGVSRVPGASRPHRAPLAASATSGGSWRASTRRSGDILEASRWIPCIPCFEIFAARPSRGAIICRCFASSWGISTASGPARRFGDFGRELARFNETFGGHPGGK